MYHNPHFTEYDIVGDEIEARLYFKGYGFDSNLFYSYSASSNVLDNINSESFNFDRSYTEHRYGFSTKSCMDFSTGNSYGFPVLKSYMGF